MLLRLRAACILGLFACLTSGPATAAETGAGVYLLGLRGPGAGLTPPEGVFLSSQTYFYDGRISGRLPVGDGQLLARARAKPRVDVPTLLWITPLQVGGARLGLSVTAPFGRMAISGSAGPIAL